MWEETYELAVGLKSMKKTIRVRAAVGRPRNELPYVLWTTVDPSVAHAPHTEAR